MMLLLRHFSVTFALAVFIAAAPSLAQTGTNPPPTAPVSEIQAPASSAAPSSIPIVTGQPSSYTTVEGDTLHGVAEKFGCTSRALRKLNKLKSSHLKPGTILEIPPVKSVSSRHGVNKTAVASAKPPVLTEKQKRALALAEALKATDKYTNHHHAPLAQPVQDFDLAPSDFASCPPPPSRSNDTDLAAATQEGVATSATPETDLGHTSNGSESPESLTMRRSGLLPVPSPTSFGSHLTARGAIAIPQRPLASTAPPAMAPLPPTSPVSGKSAAGVLTPPSEPKQTLASAIADFFGEGSSGMGSSEAGAWGNRFLVEARNLAAQGICYDGSWRPDGEARRWAMDCSNTTRYLYRVTAGIALPRTASDQYYFLHLQDKAWDVPMTASGFADCNFLRANLKPGDLLFWEYTYRPERQPPITHVMIFLGSDARGRWLMAGSQGSRGLYNRRHSGPDVYVFDPTHAVGGYTSWLGLVHHRGRFVAYGRPLEADVKKLSVATNE